jgi:hypothetical protein
MTSFLFAKRIEAKRIEFAARRTKSAYADYWKMRSLSRSKKLCRHGAGDRKYDAPVATIKIFLEG